MKAELDKAKLGKRLAGLRLERNMSQEEVAECIDVTVNTVSNYETGTTAMTISVLYRFCELYGVTPNMLLMGEDVTQPLSLSSDEVRFIRWLHTLGAARRQLVLGICDHRKGKKIRIAW